MPDNHFRDQYDFISKAKDISLSSSYEFLAARNMSTYHHWKTAIYLINNRLGERPVFFSPRGNFTKVDEMYFKSGFYPRKSDPIGRVNGEKNNASVVWAHD
jgi:hypothetical protein